MRHIRLLRILSAAALIALVPTQRVSATRTAVDGGAIFTLGGYCSPNAVGTSDCNGTALPVPIALGGTTYNSFWVNSNGTVSLASIESFLATQDSIPTTGPTLTSLTGYGAIPVFSPSFADGPGFQDFANGEEYDGNYIADTTLTAAGFTVDWYSCGSPLFCGPRTADMLSTATFSQTDFDNFTGLSFSLAQQSQLPPGTGTDQENFESGLSFILLSDRPVYTMTLTGSAGGFQVDYSYNPDATGDIGQYGFNLPTAQFEATGPLTNQSFAFDSAGALISGVPEPSTWMSMLLGFGLAGVALRRKRRLAQAPA
jgi:hypothetical protein